MIFDEKHSDLRSLISYKTELILVRPPADEADLETVQVYVPPEGWNRQQEETQLQEKVQEILLAP